MRSEVNLAVVDLSRVEPATYDIPFFAKRLGVSRGFAYTQARSGHLAGVPVIKVGSRLLVPRELADRVLRGE